LKMRASIVLSLLAAGLAVAQPPAGRRGFGPGGAPGGAPRDFETRLTQRLGLSATQQNTVHTVMAESKLSMQNMHQQMQTAHSALTEAIKSGDETRIEKAAQDMGNLHQQQTAIHAKSMAKIYATLTPDQKTKAGANLEMLMGGPMGGHRLAPPQAQRQNQQ
jgi:Spy/CpxP family protein refolding chaperone